MPIVDYESPWLTEDARIFRTTVRHFAEQELARRQTRPAAAAPADHAIWTRAGQAGLLLTDVPEQYGGGGGSFAHEAVVIEELARAGIHVGFGVQSIVAHYLLAYGNEAQKLRWLPRMASGELIAAIAMTEPNAGSDLQAIRTLARKDGAHYLISGAKTFITNAPQAGLLGLVVRTDPAASGARALSLLMVETAALAGYRVGRPLDKLGRHDQEIGELFFDNARVPADCLLGAGEGRGLFQMLDQLRYERLCIGLAAVATAEHALELTTAYAKARRLFGTQLLELQHARFRLAECATELHVGRVFIDHCIQQFMANRLDAVTAAMAKYWLTEREGRIVDECLQLHGGYGYMQEYPIGRMWIDSRVQRIYAGCNEVMQAIIGGSL